MKSKLIVAVMVLGSALFGAINSLAQVQADVQMQAQAQGQAEENPTAGVARISLIHGDVSTQRGDSGDWAAAALNAPIVASDKVSTGDRSRAEVQLDFANILRLDSNSQATIASLTRTQIQVQVGQGTVNYDVFKQSEADIEIDTPNVAIHPANKDGSFRVEVRPDGDTVVIVRKGEAEINTPKGSQRVTKGNMLTVRGSGDATEYFVAEAPSKDDWDRWNGDRDNIIHNAQAWQHTNGYYTGSEDLDAYGRWSTVPDYGSVWIPAAGPGWAPYRDGRWVWEPYWGWTWVSYEPWGWAPYHYGRWFMYGSSWAWWPGPVGGFGYGYGRRYRPIWAPAYVSFFGFGGGVGVGIGFGSVGWLPIGPCDYYHPWWGGHRNRFDVVVIHDRDRGDWDRHEGFAPLHGGDRYSNIRFVHENDRIRAGLSTVPANGFGTGHFRPEPVSRETFRDGRMMTGNLPVVPTRESLSVSNRPANPGTIRGGQDHFFMRNRPGGAPQPFDREASNVRDSIQRDGHFTPIHNNVRINPNDNRTFTTNAPASTTHVNVDGTRHSMENSGQGQNQPNQNNTGGNDGWRRSGSGGRFETRTPAQGQNPPNTNNGGNNNGGNNDSWRHSGSGRSGNQPPASTQPLETPRTPAADQSVWRRTPDSRNSGTVDTRPNSNDDWRRGARTNQGNNAPQGTQTPTQDRGDWRRSTTTTQPQNNTIEPTNRNNSNGGPNRTMENNSGGRNSGQNNSSHTESRPPLDMRQPVVRDSSSSRGSSSGSSGGGGRQSSGGGGSRSSGGGESRHSDSGSRGSGSSGSSSHGSGHESGGGRQH